MNINQSPLPASLDKTPDGSLIEVPLSYFAHVPANETTRATVYEGFVGENAIIDDILITHNGIDYSRRSELIPSLGQDSLIFSYLPGGNESFELVQELVQTGIVVDGQFWQRVTDYV